MLILVINSSEPRVRLALLRDAAVVAQQEWTNARLLGPELIQRIDTLIHEQGVQLRDLDRIVVHAGPGHYSAVRSGVVTAATLAVALDIELTSVSALTPAALIEQATTLSPQAVVEPQYPPT